MRSICLLLIMLLGGCSQCPESSCVKWEEISGRDEPQNGSTVKFPVYRAHVPSNWLREDPPQESSIWDTTKPICEFNIFDPEGKIHIAIHNFPSETLEERVPPIAQIVRWKRQLHPLKLESVCVSPQGHGGFCGLCFQGEGMMKNQPVCVLAWTMQLDPMLYQNLQGEETLYKQMRADYTIKATGPAALVEKHREALNAFARSFELIQEIPHE